MDAVLNEFKQKATILMEEYGYYGDDDNDEWTINLLPSLLLENNKGIIDHDEERVNDTINNYPIYIRKYLYDTIQHWDYDENYLLKEDLEKIITLQQWVDYCNGFKQTVCRQRDIEKLLNLNLNTNMDAINTIIGFL